MTGDQAIILAILAATVAMFVWGRWRHDMVAVGALLACVTTGLVPGGQAFAGFGHPAVVTVACVLVISRGLQSSGAVDALARTVLPAKAGPTLSIAALTALAAVLSGFMNNVGALALLMPVAMQLADRLDLPPGKVLMPLAFASILGGMTTLIGTPPNLIVSGFRDAAELGAFRMFDFTPVGLAVTAVGMVFITLVGWRLVPARKQAGAEGFDTGAYLTEARVPEDSKAAGMTLGEVDRVLGDVDAQVIGLVRNEVQLTAPNLGRTVRIGDILILEAEAEAMADTLSRLGLKLEADVRHQPEENGEKDQEGPGDKQGKQAIAAAGQAAYRKGARKDEQKEKQKGEDDEDEKEDKQPPSQEIALIELVVLPTSPLTGRSATDILLRARHGINLLAISRQGTRSVARLRTIPMTAGDVLLMQGPPEAIAEFANGMGCVPLAARALRIPDKRAAITAGVIILVAVGVAAVGLLPTAVSFAAGVLASMALRTVPPRSVYEAVDWPVIVLLAALLPVAGAMQSTGTADLIARMLLDLIGEGNPIIAVGAILIITMTLSDLMNNAATAAVMAPIALGAASRLAVNPDTFLMAVAVGASCAFLTPIGHQNNTLILGPGGFHFGDYWRVGLPLEIIIIAVSIPMLLVVWPL